MQQAMVGFLSGGANLFKPLRAIACRMDQLCVRMCVQTRNMHDKNTRAAELGTIVSHKS